MQASLCSQAHNELLMLGIFPHLLMCTENTIQLRLMGLSLVIFSGSSWIKYWTHWNLYATVIDQVDVDGLVVLVSILIFNSIDNNTSCAFLALFCFLQRVNTHTTIVSTQASLHRLLQVIYLKCRCTYTQDTNLVIFVFCFFLKMPSVLCQFLFVGSNTVLNVNISQGFVQTF